MATWEATEAIGETVEPRRQDTDWGREVVYLVRLHPVGVTEGPKTRAVIMRVKIARVEREGMEHGRLFIVSFANFYHNNPRIRVQDILEPLVKRDREKDQPALGQLLGYELVAGLNGSLDKTVDECEVVVTLHDLLRGGARLKDGSELMVQAYKEPNNHDHGTNMMVKQNPNPNEHTGPVAPPYIDLQDTGW